MKKIFLIALAAVAVGCGPGVKPKGMVISGASSNNEALISTLRQHSPDIKEAEIAVREVGGDFPEKVLEALAWAEANDIKVIMIDGNTTRSADPRVIAKIKAMSKAGIYLSAVEFA